MIYAADVDTRHEHRRTRVWTRAGGALAATVAAVLIAPASPATAAPVVPPGIPCQSQVQAFYNARQAVADHNAQPHVFSSQEQVDAYDAEGRAIFDAQMRSRQIALDCVRALAGRAAPALPDPIDHSAPTGRYPRATPSPAPPAESGDDDWTEEMQDKIYDWFKENLERVEKYQEKQQEEREKQDEQRRDHEQAGCGSTDQPPAGAPTRTTPTPALPICPAGPTSTTTTAPSTF